jgi:hypothetical protein
VDATGKLYLVQRIMGSRGRAVFLAAVLAVVIPSLAQGEWWRRRMSVDWFENSASVVHCIRNAILHMKLLTSVSVSSQIALALGVPSSIRGRPATSSMDNIKTACPGHNTDPTLVSLTFPTVKVVCLQKQEEGYARSGLGLYEKCLWHKTAE